jgi:hypothetical protein
MAICLSYGLLVLLIKKAEQYIKVSYTAGLLHKVLFYGNRTFYAFMFLSCIILS